MIVQFENEVGAGQPIVVLGTNDYFGIKSHLESVNISGHRILCINLTNVGGNVDQAAKKIVQLLDERDIRQATIVGLADSGAVAISLALSERKRIRRLVLVDAPVRPQISAIENIFSWIEGHLPLGLPFRRQSQGFDARSYLQRIRCPTLVVTTQHASSDIKSQAVHESQALATAWFKEINSPSEFISVISTFLEIPAKRPQKNRHANIPKSESPAL